MTYLSALRSRSKAAKGAQDARELALSLGVKESSDKMEMESKLDGGPEGNFFSPVTTSATAMPEKPAMGWNMAI